MATEFKYDENGNLIAYRDGKRIGEIETIGDYAKENNKKDIEKQEEGKKDMADSKKIRALLKKYGASDYEIENFMDELEEEDFSPYSQEVISKLRETDEGKAIIRDMPKMDKQELIAKIKEVINK